MGTKTIDFLTTDEVAKKEGTGRKTVIKWLEEGLITGERVKKGARTVWRIPSNYRKLAPKEYIDLEWSVFKNEWIDTQSSGYLTGKHIGKRGIETNNYGIDKFFEYLGVKHNINYITPECLREAISHQSHKLGASIKRIGV